MANNAFTDNRTKAELLLAPAKPLKRVVVSGGSLLLKLGAAAGIPGAITSATQITGAIRESMKAVLAFKEEVGKLTASLNSALTKFDALQHSFNKGTLIQKDALLQPPSSGLPDGSEYFNFSHLTPGKAIPAHFKALIAQRKKQLQAFTASISSAFNKSSGIGVQIRENFDRKPNPQKEEQDQPSVPKLAQGGDAGKSDPVFRDKMRSVMKGWNIAAGKPGFWSRILSAAHVAAIPSINTVVNQKFKDATNSGSWSEPASPFAAVFPYNHVQQTESGHVIELDDTPHAERIHIFHRSGSFIEWHPDGTVVYKNLKDGYMLTAADQYIGVKGKCTISVDGDAKIFSKGDIDIEAKKDINMRAGGDVNIHGTSIKNNALLTFKADAIMVDLRYMQLPGVMMPYHIGAGLLSGPTPIFGPQINLAALHLDFPKFIPMDLVNKVKAGADIAGGFAAKLDAFDLPLDNPLANPFIYAKKTVNAINYRSRLFDTPEEVGNFEHYAAHLDLQKTLGDHDGSVKDLGGSLRTITTNVPQPVTKPTINLLNFDDYKGKFDYSDTDKLAGTSFAIQDLVDTHIHNDVMAEDMSTPLPPVPPLPNATNPALPRAPGERPPGHRRGEDGDEREPI
jgi:hypothetical protein